MDKGVSKEEEKEQENSCLIAYPSVSKMQLNSFPFTKYISYDLDFKEK